MLTYEDIMLLFPDAKGIRVPSLSFHTMTMNSTIPQEKGLFIHAAQDADLLQAIGNGAVAAVWARGSKIPAYTPNHFPVILVDHPIEAMAEIVRSYTSKITIKKNGDLTKIMMKNDDMQYEINKKIFNEIQMLLVDQSAIKKGGESE